MHRPPGDLPCDHAFEITAKSRNETLLRSSHGNDYLHDKHTEQTNEHAFLTLSILFANPEKVLYPTEAVVV